MSRDPLTEEEMAALDVLSKNHRMAVILIPDRLQGKFAARASSWMNFVLDTGLLPPLPIPIAEDGDGLTCPYCGSVANQNIEMHALDCTWRKAVWRWGAAQLDIDNDESLDGERRHTPLS